MCNVVQHIHTQLSDSNLENAELYLCKKDPVLAKIIMLHGHCSLCKQTRSPFEQLVHSIMSQQLSAKAANTITTRVLEVIQKVEPVRIIDAPQEALRQSGLSYAKIKYIKNLSELVENKSIDLNSLSTLPTEQAAADLIKIPGVGRWTADMFLIFALKHSDVLALEDAGLKRAVKKIYGEHSDLYSASQKWHPYCSVASWYLWRHLDEARYSLCLEVISPATFSIRNAFGRISLTARIN